MISGFRMPRTNGRVTRHLRRTRHRTHLVFETQEKTPNHISIGRWAKLGMAPRAAFPLTYRFGLSHNLDLEMHAFTPGTATYDLKEVASIWIAARSEHAHRPLPRLLRHSPPVALVFPPKALGSKNVVLLIVLGSTS